MESTNPQGVSARVDGPPKAQQLSELFGSYKAEWLRERVFELYTEPSYFPELTTARPCVLVGGRGTGKTTVLRSLSFEGQFALRSHQAAAIPSFAFYGFYYRVNSNRVTAFQGVDLPESTWVRLFAHYLNLLLCEQALRFLDWYAVHVPDAAELSETTCNEVAASFNLSGCANVRELSQGVDQARTRFEAFINNVSDGDGPPISMQGAPLDALLGGMTALPQFRGREFFFLIDEYENFSEYQQRVFNTLIKHSGQLYTFKIGVKELGWKSKATLNNSEQLISPADYVLIDIAQQLEGGAFGAFARSVCNARIGRIADAGELTDIAAVLSGLTDEQEAALLGVEERIAGTRRALAYLLEAESDQRRPSALELFFIEWRANQRGCSLEDAYYELATADGRVRYENYKHALLFTIRRGKSGIRKYYAGWEVFLLLAANNIRYLLELVERSLNLHLREGGDLRTAVSAKTQTLAAQSVGKKNLGELEGLDVDGHKLVKLLLGLGRIFQVMAADAEGHSPEVNQFHLVSDSDARITQMGGVPGNAQAESLVTAAVMHLALLRTPGNKLAADTATQESDYMIHPVFSPFFVFSHRRKRKMNLRGQDLLNLISRPRDAIRDILARTDRVEEEPLPEQLALFESYYAGTA